MLCTEPKRRWDIPQILQHPWCTDSGRDPVNPNPIDADRRGGTPLPADAQVLGELEQHGISAEKTAQEILEGKHSANTATYFLLLQRERTPAGR
eukprot:Transcript_21719.p8 GENE.Transcript_21719~~Transcript_21719.p8  ORF type:complete len:94 (-),score=20.09 Transcript_21719:1144-1425(-)